MKIRLWDPVQKCFIMMKIQEDDYFIHLQAPGSNESDPLAMKNNKVIPCLYTGFKDKNGKEIYKGDILHHKYFYSPEMSFDSIPMEEIIEVKIPDFWVWLGRDVIEKSPESKEEFVKHMEIIGNIYENPEFLK